MEDFLQVPDCIAHSCSSLRSSPCHPFPCPIVSAFSFVCFKQKLIVYCLISLQPHHKCSSLILLQWYFAGETLGQMSLDTWDPEMLWYLLCVPRVKVLLSLTLQSCKLGLIRLVTAQPIAWHTSGTRVFWICQVQTTFLFHLFLCQLLPTALTLSVASPSAVLSDHAPLPMVCVNN